LTKNKIHLNVEGVGVVDFEVDLETLEKFARYCEERFPEKEWKTT